MRIYGCSGAGSWRVQVRDALLDLAHLRRYPYLAAGGTAVEVVLRIVNIIIEALLNQSVQPAPLVPRLRASLKSRPGAGFEF